MIVTDLIRPTKKPPGDEVFRCRRIGLKPGKAKGTDNPLGDGPSALRTDTAAPFDQLRFGRGIDHVTFAERLPVQTIG